MHCDIDHANWHSLGPVETLQNLEPAKKNYSPQASKTYKLSNDTKS